MSQTEERLSVQSVADLVPLLSHEKPSYRVAAFNSVLENPCDALRLAKHNDKDVVDVLIELLGHADARDERKTVLAVLGQFDDARVRDAFVSVLIAEDNDELLHLASRYVREGGLTLQTEALLSLLRCNDNTSKNRIAAELLADRGPFETSDAIRVAAFSNGTVDFPNVDTESIDAWLAELRGPLQEFLLAIVERHGPGIDAWARFWSALEPDLRVWLVRRACYEEPANEEIVLKGLADPDQHVQHATLVAIRLYGAPLGGVAMQRALDDALSSPSPRVRAAGARIELEGSASG